MPALAGFNVMRRLAPRLTASVTSAALGLGLLVVTPRAAEANAPAPDKTTFLGVEGEGDQVAALSDAIRWDLNQRGMDDGSTMTLAELKLTMGCADEDLTCFAQGGQTLGSNQLVFGSVNKQGSDYFVVLWALDVESGELVSSIERKVSFVELESAQLGKTAASLVDELYGLAVPEPEEPEEVEPEPEGPEEPEPQIEEGALVWGAYSPRPAWKYAGLGISAVLMVAGIGTGVAGTVLKGGAEEDIITEAEASLTDDKTSNDIDPNGPDVCAAAQANIDMDNPTDVANGPVTEACIKADNLGTVATVGWIGTGVFAATTILFTTLLFVHKQKSPAAAKLHRHKVGFGGAPLRDGGMVFGGSFRF